MFKKVAVIGAGVMGSGIAAQIANNEVEVLLFDLENEKGLIAEQVIQKLTSPGSAALTHPTCTKYITPLSLKKDLEEIKNCDLVIEAIIEDLKIKQEFYNNAAKYLKDTAILASNTSTFRLHQLQKGLDKNLAEKMVICHFFNPPRYMRLLELVPGNLNEKAKQNLVEFLNDKLGKDVVLCKDTPGFIANRLGCFLMELVLQESIKIKANIVDIDYVFTKLLNLPSTGIFGLYDLIGLDVMALINKSLNESLSKDDEFCKTHKEIPEIKKMIADGFKGRKGKGGFYQLKTDENGKKSKLVLSLENFEYKPFAASKLEYKSITEFLESYTEFSKFISNILDKFFSYVLKIENEIANDIYSIDAAMQLGFAWKFGPFEMMQKWNLVPQNFANKFTELHIDKSKFGIDPNELETIVHNNNLTPLLSSENTKIWQLSKRKICFEITSKMHTLNTDVFNNLAKAIDLSEQKNADLIIYSDFQHFSAGADLSIFFKYQNENNFEKVEELLKLGQQTMLRLKYAKIPVISCPRGVALGGGCELLLHSDYIVAHQDISAGLVETSIGLIPGWGGLKEMILRANSSEELNNHLEMILTSYKSTSALDFALSFSHKKVTSLANSNKLLEYALNNKFEKQTSSKKSSIASKIELNQNNYDNNIKYITELLVNKFESNLNEDELLKIEQEIFIELLATENCKTKIAKLVGK